MPRPRPGQGNLTHGSGISNKCNSNFGSEYTSSLSLHYLQPSYQLILPGIYKKEVVALKSGTAVGFSTGRPFQLLGGEGANRPQLVVWQNFLEAGCGSSCHG